jgi:hypothetical protein
MVLSISDEEIHSGIRFIHRDKVNATDGTILQTYLNYSLGIADDESVVVSADSGLLDAAVAEGLRCINPELASDEEIESVLVYG